MTIQKLKTVLLIDHLSEVQNTVSKQDYTTIAKTLKQMYADMTDTDVLSQALEDGWITLDDLEDYWEENHMEEAEIALAENGSYQERDFNLDWELAKAFDEWLETIKQDN